MNREIKFRAWDLEIKTMFPIAELHMIKLGERQISAYVVIEGVAVYRDEIEVMQYTGLTDKNGKDIYEGDLIKCVYCGSRLGEVFYLADMTRFQLAWHGRDCGNCRHTKIGAWSEVVGNIHENPELLG